MKVVVVDDSRLSVSALQNILAKLGHEIVDSAFDGESGIEKVKQHKPDVVCLDFVMPNKNGLETANGIRKVAPGTKIIMITQKEIDPSIKTQINAVDYVIKPITSQKLEAAFKKV